MDLSVRFWDTNKDEISTRYLNSSFLGHSTASDLTAGFLEASKGLNLRTLLQVSMDGPNVNKKFLKDLTAYLKGDINTPILLDLGSCGLHTIHNAYKASMKCTEWDLVTFLRNLNYLFKHVPARRDDYVRYTGSTIFPLNFCAVRWLENFRVAERAGIILPFLKKYIEEATKNKTEPACKSYTVVKEWCHDRLLLAKLAFFQTIAADLYSFLLKFQSDAPLVPELYENLMVLLRRVLERFVKKDVILANTNLAKIKLDKENLLPAKNIDIGFATKHALKKSQPLKDSEIFSFRKDCKRALLELANRIIDRSPLIYSVVKGLSCLDPSVAGEPKSLIGRLDIALNVFVEHNWLSGIEADEIKKQMSELSSQPNFDMSSFDSKSDRLDHFWLRRILPKMSASDINKFPDLKKFMKQVFILSHGNAFCERGFSINKVLVDDNMTCKSIISQRVVKDAINSAGKVSNIPITKQMILKIRNARGLYEDFLSEQKKKKENDVQQKKEERRLSLLKKELLQKKKKVLEDAQIAASKIEDELKNLE